MISICIPTYNRPGLLREALESCFAQTYTDYEIIIGDDSKNEASAELVAEYVEHHADRIRYQHNVPSLGQAANVNDLFARARGERLVLLHDDDALLPVALERLAACWDAQPGLVAAFGKQIIIDHAGTPRTDSDAVNATYHRVSANAGRQAVPAVAGLLRMFPNDGYMVLTEAARAAGYRSRAEVGDACDTDFGLRLCAAAAEVWFVDEFLAKYRNSDDSITRQNFLEPFAYDVIRTTPVPAAALPARRRALEDLAPNATSGFAQLGRPGEALAVFTSPYYTLRDKLRPRAAYHAGLIAAAYVRNLVRR